MTYSIIGLGAIGQALAGAFARKGIEATVASKRPVEELATIAAQAGPMVTARALEESLEADVVFLAMPFSAHPEIAGAKADWHGRLVVDVTNAFRIPPEKLDGLPSTLKLSRAFTNARVVKAFNHLPAKILAQDPAVNGGRRVVFVSSDDEAAAAEIADLAGRLGFAAVKLGGLSEGGRLVQARGDTWAPLIFQDLVKFD